MRARAVLVAIGALALSSACASGGSNHASGNPHLISVLSATRAAESFRYQTVTRDVMSGSVHETSSHTTDGEVDYAHGLSLHTRPPTDPDVPAFEFRWVGGIGYQLLDAQLATFYGAPKGTKWISTDGSRIAAAGGCTAYSFGSPASSLVGGGTLSVGLPRPEGGLDSLRAAGAALEKVGTDDVRGTSTTHWRIDASGVTTTTIPANCNPSLDGVHQGERHVEIWTDAENRLRRVQYTSTTTITNSVLGQSSATLPSPGPSTIARTTTTEFFDFGVSVHVEAPPSDEVFDATAQEGAMLAGPGTVADRDWQDVARGSFRGADWTLWYARTDTKWRCYSAEGLPPLEGGPPELPNAVIYPKHDGRRADCLPSAGGELGNGPFTAVVAGVDGGTWVLVGRIDDSASDVKLRFANGSSMALPIDPQSRVIEWSGPVSPAPTEIDSGVTRCTLSDSVATTGDEQTCDGVD